MVRTLRLWLLLIEYSRTREEWSALTFGLYSIALFWTYSLSVFWPVYGMCIMVIPPLGSPLINPHPGAYGLLDIPCLYRNINISSAILTLALFSVYVSLIAFRLSLPSAHLPLLSFLPCLLPLRCSAFLFFLYFFNVFWQLRIYYSSVFPFQSQIPHFLPTSWMTSSLAFRSSVAFLPNSTVRFPLSLSVDQYIARNGARHDGLRFIALPN